MKILHVINTVSLRSGGPQRVLIDLTRAQRAVGHEVAVVASDREHPATTVVDQNAYRALYEAGVALFLFPVVMMRSLLFSPAMGIWLFRHMRQFDVVHIHGCYRFPTTAAGLIARILKVPYVIRPHGNLDPYLFKQSSRSLVLKRIYETLFDFPNFRAAGAIHYTAETERDQAARFAFGAPAFVVPNGLDWQRYEQLPPKGAFRASLGIPPQAPLLLFLGRLNFKKGLDLLVPAFAAIRARHGDARLAIVGPDNEGYGATVRAMVAAHGLGDAVHLVDVLAGREVFEAYIDADLFLLPSYGENFGMTVIESLACGTPVIISDQVNIHEDVARSGAGVVVPCDETALAAAVVASLSAPAARKAMGPRGRVWVKDNYSWSSIVRLLDEPYAAAIARTGARATR